MRCVDLILSSGVNINVYDTFGENALAHYCNHAKNTTTINPLLRLKSITRLLYVAGEKSDLAQDFDICDYLHDFEEKFHLKNICRKAIRKHLIDANPHLHLFGRIPQLHLPSLLTKYLLYDLTLYSQ